jgi:hypothetical protein
MKHTPAIAALALCASLANAQGSDSCATAQALPGVGTFPFDLTTATTDGLPDGACTFFSQSDITNDVWFTWTATANDRIRVETCTLASLDTKIAVLAGGCAGTVVACNDDACSLQSRLEFSAVAGTTYTIRLGLYPGATPGAGQFKIDVVPPLAILGTVVNPANGRTYHLLEGSSWSAAQARAVQLGGNLVTINDQAEQDFLLANLHTFGGVTRDLWTGFNDVAAEGQFTWVSGEASSFTLWDLGEPNNAGAGEDYANLRKNNPLGLWNDLPDAPTGFHANPSGVVEVGGGFPTFCYGDGSATACPCGNASPAGAEAGCLSSLGGGATLRAAGSASVANDSLVLQGGAMPNSNALYFQGTTRLSGGAGAVFGDGLRCAGGTVIRLGTKLNAAGSSQYPGAADARVSVRGLVPAGATRTYQAWYRNAAAYCTASTFNLTNGYLVQWTP